MFIYLRFFFGFIYLKAEEEEEKKQKIMYTMRSEKTLITI